MANTYASKTVIVAGGTGALGRAVSEAFLREGATVITPFHTASEFQSLATAQCDEARARLRGEQVDVTDEAAVGRLIAGVIQRHSRIDVLVNAVGGYAGDVKLWDMESAVLDRMLALNLRPLHALARAVVPEFLKQGHGAIVNVAARAALDPPAGGSAYAASKAAALAMAQSLAAELAGTGIRINSILPRIIDTPANRKAMPKANYAKWTTPEKIADVILFLCSDAAAAVHGAALPV
jgi:NAD(P)-dependent dehydrogenase (short-subunit alcohol dehydrogenase family)